MLLCCCRAHHILLLLQSCGRALALFLQCNRFLLRFFWNPEAVRAPGGASIARRMVHVCWWVRGALVCKSCEVQNVVSCASLCTFPSLPCTVSGHRIFEHLAFPSSNSAFVFPCYLFSGMALTSHHCHQIHKLLESVAIPVNDAAFPFMSVGILFLHFTREFSSLPVSNFNCKSPAVLILLLSR